MAVLGDGNFARSIERWFDGLYRDKYEVMGDAELAGASFYLDTALYDFGVVGPILRDVEALGNPTLGLEAVQARMAHRFLSFYRGRLVTLARKRVARGTYGRRNRDWRCLSGGFGDPRKRSLPRPFWKGLRLWLGAEVSELNPFARRVRARDGEAVLKPAERGA